MTPVFERIAALFAERGEGQYGSERVTQRAHALQCAALAAREGAADALIVAALLHDVGHLVHDLGTDARTRGVDDKHETRAAEWLAGAFGEEVVAPVRLHVAAKRWLCAVDPAYYAILSPASRRSLELQGGPFTAAQAEAFASAQHAEDAAQLRRWDDAAKDPVAVPPPLETYRPLVERLARA
jgi:[1-hydroxy-2-(trimethylamino)ethyl]phosphonate dioxygenase